MATERILWASHRIAGAYYYGKDAGYIDLAYKYRLNKNVGDLVLRRNPSNPHDQKAIQVLAPDGRTLIGHVPAANNTQLGILMDKFGQKVVAELTQANFSTHTLYMNIYLLKDVPDHTVAAIPQSATKDDFL